MSYLTSKGILPSVGLSTGLAPCCQPPHQSCIISVGHHIKSDSLLWATTSNLIPCCGPRHQSWLPDVLHCTPLLVPCCGPPPKSWFSAVGHGIKAGSLLWATTPKAGPRLWATTPKLLSSYKLHVYTMDGFPSWTTYLTLASHNIFIVDPLGCQIWFPTQSGSRL
jgi:hypothetical protein